MSEITSTCPVCDAQVNLAAGTAASEIIVCAECSCELEVLRLDPVELAEAPQEEEDWGQ